MSGRGRLDTVLPPHLGRGRNKKLTAALLTLATAVELATAERKGWILRTQKMVG